MNRKGFDKKIHPNQLQLRICSGFDFQGLQNRGSVTLDFREGRIKSYRTDEDMVSTTIREYVASDEELTELYSFFTFDAVEKFEVMPDSKKSHYQIGYYDLASLRYLMISEGGRVLDGKRSCIYSNDPIEMAVKWMRKTAPFNLDI